jgi:hypothetical protein
MSPFLPLKVSTDEHQRAQIGLTQAEARHEILLALLAESNVTYKLEVADTLANFKRASDALKQMEARAGVEIKRTLGEQQRKAKAQLAYVNLLKATIHAEEVKAELDYATKIRADWMRIQEQIPPSAPPTSQSKTGRP